MRVLFTCWAWPTHFQPMVPLAWAFRAAGHEVAVASAPSLTPTILAAGLPALPMSARAEATGTVRRLLGQDFQGQLPGVSRTVARYAEMAGAMIDPMHELLRTWRPELVVFEVTTYAAPLVARRLGIPAVRFLWGLDIMSFVRWYERHALAPLVRRLALDQADTAGAATLDPCPPALQVPDDFVRVPMRYVPYNRSGPAHHPALRRSARPRVCFTYGVTLSQVSSTVDVVGAVVRALAGLDVDAVALLADADRQRLRQVPGSVRVLSGVPLCAAMPGCDLLISHGGPGAALTAATYGLPQLAIPQVGDQVVLSGRLAEAGVGIALPPEQADVDGIREATLKLLGDASYRTAAAQLRAEMSARPGLTSVVEDLVGNVSAGRW